MYEPKEGDKAIALIMGRWHSGMIGEIKGDYLYFWNNTISEKGLKGDKAVKGYKYSYLLPIRYNEYIKLIKRA